MSRGFRDWLLLGNFVRDVVTDSRRESRHQNRQGATWSERPHSGGCVHNELDGAERDGVLRNCVAHMAAPRVAAPGWRTWSECRGAIHASPCARLLAADVPRLAVVVHVRLVRKVLLVACHLAAPPIVMRYILLGTAGNVTAHAPIL